MRLHLALMRSCSAGGSTIRFVASSRGTPAPTKVLDIAEDRAVAQNVIRLVHSDHAEKVWMAFQAGCNAACPRAHAINLSFIL